LGVALGIKGWLPPFDLPKERPIVTDEIADDLLRGVKRIAQFINDDERSTNHKLVTGKVPGGKEGSQWIASKTVLRDHYAKITGFKAS
jgi:hypothetical protein